MISMKAYIKFLEDAFREVTREYDSLKWYRFIRRRELGHLRYVMNTHIQLAKQVVMKRWHNDSTL